MFIKIEKEEGITPITIDTWIKKERENGIAPKEAMQVLKWSNFYGNIKAVIKEIRVYNDVRVYRMFEDFIISAVDGRETSNDTLKMLRDLAVECGIEEEFDKANDKPKVYGKTDSCNSMYYGIESWYKDLDEKATVIHISNAPITNLFAYTNKKAPKKLVMKDCKQIEFAKCVEMDRFVAIKVAGVKLNEMDLLPKNIELSDCGVVNFCGSNLTDANIKLKKCGKVIFNKETKFPEVLDLSEVDEVDLSGCDLANVKEIKFKKGAKVNLEYVKNLSPSIDLSAPAELDLIGVDISYIEDAVVLGTIKSDESTRLPKKITFTGEEVKIYKSNIEKCEEVVFAPSVKKVWFSTYTKFPEVLDLSEVDEVDLRNCDLANVKEIKFKKGAKVNLEDVENLSQSIDLTAPAELDLSGVDVSYIEDRSALGVITYNRGTKFPKKMFFKQKEVDIFDLNIANCEEVVFAPSVKKVSFSKSTIFPEVLDLSEVDEVDLAYCDLANVKEIKFKKGGVVDLSYVENLPPSLDLTAPAELALKGVDVSYIEDSSVLGTIKSDESTRLPKKMVFKEKTVNIYGENIENCEEVVFAPSVKNVWFDKNTIFPEVLDLSEVDEVELGCCDLANVKEIKFKKGAKVKLYNVKNLSPSIDLSGLSEIDVKGTDVSFVEDSSVLGVITYNSDTRLPKKMVFKEEAVDIFKLNIANCEEVVFAPSVKKVKFGLSTEFSEVLDFSQCDDIEISVEDVEKMKRVIFRDKEQRDKILENMDLGPIDRIRLKRKSEYVGSNVKKNSKTISVPQREMGD